MSLLPDFSENDLEREKEYWTKKLQVNCERCHGKGWYETEQGIRKCGCVKRIFVYPEMIRSGFGKAYLEYDFNNIVKNNFTKKCKEYLMNFPKYFESGKGLFLFGEHGRGKTTIETIIVKEILLRKNPDGTKNFSSAFFLYDDLVRKSLDKDIRYSELDNLFRKTDILVLDNIGSEIGLESKGKSSVLLLEKILRIRHMIMKPIILSANYDFQDIETKYSPVIASLIESQCICVRSTGKDIRKQKANELNGGDID